MFGDKKKLNIEVVGTSINGWMCSNAKKYQGLANLIYRPNVNKYGIICDREQRRFCEDDSQCAIIWDASMTKKGKESFVTEGVMGK